MYVMIFLLYNYLGDKKINKFYISRINIYTSVSMKKQCNLKRRGRGGKLFLSTIINETKMREKQKRMQQN